jgi:hypothetical protein
MDSALQPEHGAIDESLLEKIAMEAPDPTEEQLTGAEELCMYCLGLLEPGLLNCPKCGARTINPLLLG